jgi:hypothetical protein
LAQDPHKSPAKQIAVFVYTATKNISNELTAQNGVRHFARSQRLAKNMIFGQFHSFSHSIVAVSNV